ncbi:oxidoreductase [Armatimonadota bacterium]|nr:oxidoreductase [Armatimonadota bacterium]
MFKAVIVGAGGMGKAWGGNLKDCSDTEVVGWVDVRSDAAKESAEKYEFAGIYTGDDLGKAIAETCPDFVVDVTIPEAHCDVTVQALEAGIPVIGEKPMAVSMEQARKMVATSERMGKLYMVSQSRRYNNRLKAYREIITRYLGELGILNSDFYIGAHFGGFRDEMPSPLILDMAIHTFDAARYLSGADAVSVYCEEFNPEWSWYRGNACATAIFEMSNGIRYTYSGSWCSEGKHTSWEGEWRSVGANGTALWDGTHAPNVDVVEETGSFHSKCLAIEGEVVEGYEGIAGSLRDFLNALKTGQTPMGECHDNIKSLAMVFAAIESALEGRRVAVPLE